MDVTHLFLGYQRNDVEISKSSIWLVCPDGKRVKWIAELTSADEAGGAMEIGIVGPTDPMSGQTEGRRIKPKVAIAQGETADSKNKKDDSNE